MPRLIIITCLFGRLFGREAFMASERCANRGIEAGYMCYTWTTRSMVLA